jgi:hypothetical protein
MAKNVKISDLSENKKCEKITLKMLQHNKKSYAGKSDVYKSLLSDGFVLIIVTEWGNTLLGKFKVSFILKNLFKYVTFFTL